MESSSLDLAHSLQYIEAFSQIGQALTSSLDKKVVLQVILQKVTTLFHPSSWALYLVDEKTQILGIEILINQPGINRMEPIKMDESLAGHVFKSNQSLLYNQSKPILPIKVHKDISTSMICLLKSRGRTLGLIELNRLQNDKLPNYNEHDLKLLNVFADFAAISIENAKIFEKIEELTIKDDITELYNSRHLHHLIDTELNRAIRYHKEFSMIFFDLDRFKMVNDTWGHIHGSELIREVGQIVKAKIRDVDHGARYGGDEFVVLLPETNKKDAVMIAERLRSTIENHQFLKHKGLSIQFTASFGVANYPSDASSKEDLIKMADDAMYKVKHTSKNKVQSA